MLAAQAPVQVTVVEYVAEFFAKFNRRAYGTTTVANAKAGAEALMGMLRLVLTKGGREELRLALHCFKDQLAIATAPGTMAARQQVEDLFSLLAALVDAAERLRQFSPVKESISVAVLEEVRYRVFRILAGDGFADQPELRRRALDLTFCALLRERAEAARQAARLQALAAAAGGVAQQQPGSPSSKGSLGRQSSVGSSPSKPTRLFAKKASSLAGPDVSSWEGLWNSLGSMPGRRMLPLLQSVMLDWYMGRHMPGSPAAMAATGAAAPGMAGSGSMPGMTDGVGSRPLAASSVTSSCSASAHGGSVTAPAFELRCNSNSSSTSGLSAAVGAGALSQPRSYCVPCAPDAAPDQDTTQHHTAAGDTDTAAAAAAATPEHVLPLERVTKELDATAPPGVDQPDSSGGVCGVTEVVASHQQQHQQHPPSSPRGGPGSTPGSPRARRGIMAKVRGIAGSVRDATRERSSGGGGSNQPLSPMGWRPRSWTQQLRSRASSSAADAAAAAEDDCDDLAAAELDAGEQVTHAAVQQQQQCLQLAAEGTPQSPSQQRLPDEHAVVAAAARAAEPAD